ncbi:XAC2610-related protein [Flavisolibacter ginsenosidimutans]|uniref:Nitrite reductase n=1 Tax=Flavisolibacter ginsenosidimutans TaxID=661481 RepID=A0A5B8UPL5_9BACT|nr:nitrite reductase [Flavisolibacter ginsenosidimutans]QEC57885.1 nitrite reductase [Flavisolibacter ginsenosidimutans]
MSKYKLLATFILLSFIASSQTKLAYQDKKFSFVLLVDSANGECAVKSIALARRSDGKQIQAILPPENTQPCTLPKEQIFIIEDMNFDGYNDIRLLQFLPAAPNLPYYCWIYKTKQKRFERQKALEEITSPDFNAKQKRIFSFWRDGCCDHGLNTYKYIGGRPVLVEQGEVKEEGGKVITTLKKRINGKLKLVKKTTEKAKE